MGVIQRAMVKACPHVWFERSEVKDRHLVAKRWVHNLSLLHMPSRQGLWVVLRMVWGVAALTGDRLGYLADLKLRSFLGGCWGCWNLLLDQPGMYLSVIHTHALSLSFLPAGCPNMLMIKINCPSLFSLKVSKNYGRRVKSQGSL